MLYFFATVLALGALGAIFAVGLNLQFGQAGILNFTAYTFIAIGAYITAVTTMGTASQIYGTQTYILRWSLPWPLGVLIGGLAASAIGLVVAGAAFRRLRSDYLAIVTVSVGLIIWNLISNEPSIFNGASGLVGIPPISDSLPLGSIENTLVTLGIGLVVLAVFLWVVRRIARSPYGRVLRALREDEIVAASFGKRVLAARIVAFELGCFICGVGGGLFVIFIGSWNPSGWLPLESFFLIAAIIIGGTGNYYGAVLGAFLVIHVIPELLRFAPSVMTPSTAGAVRGIAVGIALILILRFRPGGLLPESRLRGIYKRSKGNVATNQTASE
jgi:branched-chain amino acid transport system permease protein